MTLIDSRRLRSRLQRLASGWSLGAQSRKHARRSQPCTTRS